MDELEQELRRALTRKEPSADFAKRVEAEAAAARREERRSGRAQTLPYVTRWWLAVAAMVVIAVGGGAAYRHHQGEVAKEQVMTAMRFTSVKLHRIQAQVREVRQ